MIIKLTIIDTKICFIFKTSITKLPFTKSNLRENSFTHLRYFLTFLLLVLLKNNLTSQQSTHESSEQRESANWIDAQSLCLGFTSFNAPRPPPPPLVYSLKQSINYCCRVCTILCMIFKKCLFIESLCRPSYTKYMHCNPITPISK